MFAKIKAIFSIAAALVISLGAGSAFADDTGSVATAKEQTRLMSVTFSPIHLALPIVELAAEFKAHDDWGVAVIGGYGSVTNTDVVLGEQTFQAWEAGGQLRYYALGDFNHGLQLGAEVLYMHVSDNIETVVGTIRGTGDGLSAGPFLGYKIVTELGFTFDAQAGYQRIGIGAEAEHRGSGTTSEDESTEWGPLLNLNVGWSF